MKPKCSNEECVNECSKSLAPKELFVWTVPYTEIEIRIWDYSRNGYEDYCTDCLIDMQNEPRDSAYSAGYDQAIEDNLAAILSQDD